MRLLQIVGDQIQGGIPTAIPNHFPPGAKLVLGFDVSSLDFGPPIWDMRLFPGGEWHNRSPIYSTRLSSRSRPVGCELWKIGTSLPLMVVSSSMAIRMVEVQGRNIYLRVPESAEMLGYLRQRIDTYIERNNRKGVDWAEKCIRIITGQGASVANR